MSTFADAIDNSTITFEPAGDVIRAVFRGDRIGVIVPDFADETYAGFHVYDASDICVAERAHLFATLAAVADLAPGALTSYTTFVQACENLGVDPNICV